MDDLHRPLSIETTRKRKAEGDDCEPGADDPSKLLDPPLNNSNIPTPRLSLHTAATACTESGGYTTGLQNSPLPSLPT